jgi:tetratricopeptide (TPR) repeat protein
LNWFWWLHGNWSEARGWYEEALTRRRDAPRALLPDVYFGATNFAWRLGDYEHARKLSNEGLAIARELGDRKGSAFLLLNLGIVAMREIGYGEAAERFEEAVRLAREAGDRWCLSVCLSQQGILARYQGDLGLAAVLHEEALALVREMGDPAVLSYTLRCLGIVSLQQADFQRSARFFAESLRLSREPGFRWMIFECLVGFAGVSSAHGKYDRAARLFAAAEALREAIGHRPSPQDLADYDRRLVSTRSALGEAAFTAAWAEGRAMTLEQAIEYALNVASDSAEGNPPSRP